MKTNVAWRNAASTVARHWRMGVARWTPAIAAAVLAVGGGGTEQPSNVAESSPLKARIKAVALLEDGSIHVGRLNHGNQNYEIWRFGSGEVVNHDVVFGGAR